MNRLEFIKNHISGTVELTKINIYYQGSVAYISMRSPKDLNCLSTEMLSNLVEALNQLRVDN